MLSSTAVTVWESSAELRNVTVSPTWISKRSGENLRPETISTPGSDPEQDVSIEAATTATETRRVLTRSKARR
jgi:hypothetical protein